MKCAKMMKVAAEYEGAEVLMGFDLNVYLLLMGFDFLWSIGLYFNIF